MTPKRYFAFGCLTVLIQGGVLASQNTEPELMLSAGSAMGSNQAVSISIAMQASQANKAVEQIKPALEKQTKPSPRPLAKPLPESAATPVVKAKPITEPELATQPKPAPSQDTEKPIAEINEIQVAHNQIQVDAKQGVTQQSITLSQPTFAAPPAQPHYPKKARKRGFQGTATVEVMFNQLGEQLSLTLVGSSGYRLLDKAALNAVEQWQFAAPTPQTAYAYTVRVPVKFALN
ncbi:TonB family protein [Shewanella halifaxensis HAW-EB4]|uniref:TonB family protein n=1 Tax=Shewanella halifaxensis (strain HAW-EB4) TaxID=458817 RepID=B0TSJ2_SHEHH|nr:energy transducer TonB [Shewanella halifaxensis]ABZ77946.1 TonB family protein [Shewanella halifaxensis HAW-EB4]